nr:auxilin-like protein [Tanacetum cinerariifolium]
MVRDVLFDVCRRAEISAQKEAAVNFLTDQLDGRSILRPVDALIFRWVGGKDAYVDLTGFLLSWVKIHNYWRGLEGRDRTRVLCFPTDGGDPATWEYYTSPSVSLTMSEEDQAVGTTVLPKFDMPSYELTMTAKDVKSLALQHGIPLDLHPVVDLRPVPYGLLFQGGLATTWDFPGFCLAFKDTEGNVVTMSEYLRFRFLSGAFISKGHTLTSQDQIEQHTTRLLPSNQNIPEKTNHQKRVEVEDPKIVATRERKARAAAKKREKRQGGDGGEGSHPATKRRKTIACKDGPDASEDTSSLEPLWTVNPTDTSGAVAETAESREDCSPRISPQGLANHSVHNYFGAQHDNKETETLRLGTSDDQSGRAMTNVNTEVVHPSLTHRSTHHSPIATQLGSPPWSIQ